MAARAASVGYSVINNGMVSAAHGNITLMSRVVVQNGALEASTALNNRNGSISLRAYGDGMMSYASSISEGSPLRYWTTGTLTLGGGSVTTAMPDLMDTSEIEQSSLAARYSPGSIELRGKLIDIEARANVIAPTGKITIVASSQAATGVTPIASEQYLYDGSRVYIGEEAYLSVAGLQDMLLTMESNVVTGEMRINELRDSPLYRDGWLRGKTVSVDKRVAGLFSDGPMANVDWVSGSPGAWVGTPLGDFSGWIGVGKTTLGELSANAGGNTLLGIPTASIQIKSGGSIVTRAGSLLDVSGGSVRYQDGWITTTKLLGADGRVYDIGQAMPDQLYVGFAGSFARTHMIQGQIDSRLTETWASIFDRGTSRRFERGYTVGKDAGLIRMFAAEVLILDGGYWGGVVNGEKQLASGELAKAGTVTIGGPSDEHGRWLIGDLVISSDPRLLPADYTATSPLDPRWGVPAQLKPPQPDPNDPTREIPQDPRYANSWIEPVKVTYLDSDVLAQSGMGTFNFFVRNSLTLAKGENLELAPSTSFNVTINSSAPTTRFTVDGSIRIAGGSISLAGAKIANYGATAHLDVSGEWLNGPRGALPPAIKGGSIAVTGDFAPGAIFDVSGGGWYDTTSVKPKLRLGDAGALSLVPSDVAQLAALDLRAYSAASGGTLSVLTSGSIQIGGRAPVDSATGWLPASLFAERGFRGFALTTTGDILVADGAVIDQKPQSVDLANLNPATIATGARIGDLGPLTILPLIERAALKPTSLTLVGDNITIGTGAVVKTDVGGSVALTAAGHKAAADITVPGDMIIRGTIDAPAGTISLTANGTFELAADGQILARGAAVVDRDVRGIRTGSVRAGGSVAISQASVVTLEQGSLIDVSGTSDEFDIDLGRSGAQPYTIASDGGRISLEFSGTARDVIAGSFNARSGGSGATGGALDVRVGSAAEETPMFDLPGTLYYVHRDTGAVTPVNSRGNLDIYREYSTGSDAAYRYSTVLGLIRAASTSLSRGGGLAIADLASDTTGAGVGQPLSSVMPASINQLALLTKYFYLDSNLIQRVELPSAMIKLTKISSDAINHGGFGALNVNSTAFMVAPGVHLSLGKSFSLIGSFNSGGAGTASITAPYMALTSGTGAVNAAGTGKLVLHADLIDVTRAAFSNFAETQLVAGEVRMGGILTNLMTDRTSVLTADGRLEFKVGQLYPATGILASIKAGGELAVTRHGDVGLPLSAAGTLMLEAPSIVQNGVVRAPFGSIVFKATDSITLGAGSITSVSGDGVVVPYGTLSNNEFWNDPLTKATTANPTPTLSKLPEKNIVLEGPKVNLAAGSVVDIRGGGDLYAWEHVPGPGGSHDVLATPGVYAIMPGANVSGGSQQKIWLAGGNGLAQGWYELLPARYALLPGAFAVSMVKGASSAQLFGTTTRADGSMVMSGYQAAAFGGGHDQLASSWRVMSGAVLRGYSEYHEAYANTYFASDTFKLGQYRLNGINIVTPRLAMDGGSVVFKSTSSLMLDGMLQSQPAAGGRGGLVDIAGSKIAIVGTGQDRSDLSGYLVIDATSLSRFGAGSLLVGGVRSVDARGMRIDVSARDVLVRNDAGSSLTGSEIVLAASGTVRVDDGSVVGASGHSPGDGVDLVMAPQVKAVYGDIGTPDTNPNNDVLLSPSRDYGALIRVSNSNAVKVIRENVDTTTGGLVTIGANAAISGGNALLIDATGDTSVAGSARLSGAALSLASGRIGFGGGSNGLVLDAPTLAQLANTQALTLRSYTTMDFYTSVDLGGAGLRTVTFDATGLVGYGNDIITVTGDTIALENSSGTFASPGAAGHARMLLNANDIILGSGAKALRGFDAVTLAGSRQVSGQGTGSLDAGAAAVTLISPVVTGRGGASQSITTQNVVRVIGSGDAPIENPEASLGTRFVLTGTSVELGGRIVALGGAVNLTATAGDVTIASGGLIDVGGFRKQFFEVAQFADAGSIALTAVGSVIVAPDGHLNLSAHAEGGDAGRLALTTSNGGTVSLGGSIEAKAGAGQKGGWFALDIAALPDFAGMNQTLNVAGFSASRQFRIRSGNVVIDGLTEVADFSLVADQGAVTLAGTIDARAAYGGNISISAGNGLTMLSSALLQAGATGEFGSGRVTIEAGGGRMDIAGGTIDVAGADGGRVRFRAPQSAGHDDIAVDRLQVAVLGARSTVLEGLSVELSNGSVDAVRGDAISQAMTFANSADAIARRLNAGSIAVIPGIEIRSTGDLTLETDWNLGDLVAARMGSLTLRAGGNLLILGNLSDGFSAADRSGLLESGASWDLRLVSGADLTSSNALTVRPLAAQPTGSGSLIVGDTTAGKVVRTGTGDIDVVVGRDLALSHSESAIYTAGRRDTTIYSDFDTPDGAAYGIEGGHLRIAVEGSSSAALPANPRDNQLFVEWLKKTGTLDRSYAFEQYTDASGIVRWRQSSWWTDFGEFQQGVGALGGGNVSVATGGNLVNMLVALPTNGRVRGGRTANEAKTLEIRNGGSLDVQVGGSVLSGYIYAARGAGTVIAGDFGIGRSVTVHLGQNYYYQIAPVLALGDATMRVRTAGDLFLQTVMDPLLLDSGAALGGNNSRDAAQMSGYGDRSSVELVSVGGDVILVNQGRYLSKDLDLGTGIGATDADTNYSVIGRMATNLYPAVTRIAALNGSIVNANRLYTAPGSTTELRLLADADVTLGEIYLARATVAMMPSWSRPIGGDSAPIMLNWVQRPREFQAPNEESGFHALLLNKVTQDYYFGLGTHNAYLMGIRNPDVLQNADDDQPSRIYARTGSLIGSIVDASPRPRLGKVTTNEQTWFRAGADIRNIDYNLRNLHRTDVSLLEAGNDVIGGAIDIQGPGAIVVGAGRDVYGSAFQIFSRGNYDSYSGSNRASELSEVKGLPRDGAAISVLAGLKGKQPSYDAMLSAYLDPAGVEAMPDYLKTTVDGTVLPIYLTDGFEARKDGEHQARIGLVSFMREITGEELSPLAAWARFRNLPELTQQRFVRQVFSQELKAAGDDQNTQDQNGRPLNGGYNRGYTAIAALLPSQDWRGDVKIGNATFRTMAGGSIETLTPGGQLQVAALGTVVPDGAGLVTLGSGDIRIFARDSVTVNRSRVLTFAGGDEIIWSTYGDIDAGRGAKTTRVPSAPEITTDEDAVTKVQEKADIGGSGIGTIIGFAGVKEGDVSLIAPQGTVNAGDAGIRVSGNFTVAALFVLNAENIKVEGVTKGMPKMQSAPVSLNVETKDKAAADAVKDATQSTANERPSVIIVEVLGYGGGERREDNNEDRPARRRNGEAYDLNNSVELIGVGRLTESQKDKLSPEERARAAGQ